MIHIPAFFVFIGTLCLFPLLSAQNSHAIVIQRVEIPHSPHTKHPPSSDPDAVYASMTKIDEKFNHRSPTAGRSD